MDTLLNDRATRTPITRTPGSGRTLDVLGAPYVIKASAAETGGGLCCIECEVPAGSGVPPHTHANEDEAFYVLAGTITFEIAGEGLARLGPGSFVYGPRGRQHAFRNETDAGARMLVTCSPGAAMEQMFTDIDAAARQSGGRLAGEAIGAIAARYGVVIAPPNP